MFSAAKLEFDFLLAFLFLFVERATSLISHVVCPEFPVFEADERLEIFSQHQAFPTHARAVDVPTDPRRRDIFFGWQVKRNIRLAKDFREGNKGQGPGKLHIIQMDPLISPPEIDADYATVVRPIA